VEPEAGGPNAFNFGVKVGIVAVGENIEVIEGGGTAAKEKLGGGDGGSIMKLLKGHSCPEVVQISEPIEEFSVGRSRQVASEGLIEVVMAIYQPRHDQMMGGIDDMFCLREVRPGRVNASYLLAFD